MQHILVDVLGSWVVLGTIEVGHLGSSCKKCPQLLLQVSASQSEYPKAEILWMNVAMDPGTPRIGHRRDVEAGWDCLGSRLAWGQSGWLQSWLHGQQSCGQLEPQVNVHNIGTAGT